MQPVCANYTGCMHTRTKRSEYVEFSKKVLYSSCLIVVAGVGPLGSREDYDRSSLAFGMDICIY